MPQTLEAYKCQFSMNQKFYLIAKIVSIFSTIKFLFIFMIARSFTRLVVSSSKSASKMQINAARPAYAFCNNLTPANMKPKLLKIVEKENKYETENYQRDESSDEFLKKVGFQLKDLEHNQNMELKKTIGDTTVVVCFQSRSPNQDQDDEQSIQQDPNDQNQEDQNQEEDQDYADFTVYFQKGSGKAMCYECTSMSSEITVNQVSIVENVEEHKSIPRFERGVKEYQGPEFSTLDEKLQSALQQYLKGFGINEEVAAFIEHYSLDKEQRLYMSWLKTLEQYLKH